MRRVKAEFPFKEPILTPAQLDKTSDIFIAAGQLSAASLVLPFIAPALDKSKINSVILGLGITFAFWITSVLIVRKLK